MPTLKEIKGRIGSVKNTLKITSAMKLVSSAKLRKVQAATESLREYEKALQGILAELGRYDKGAPVTPDTERESLPRAIVAMASNSSLCGGFNANIIKMMQRTVDCYTEELGQGSVEVYPIGRKVAEKARKLGYTCHGDYAALVDHPNVHQCIEIVMELGERFAKGEIDRVELIYHHFKSAGSQVLTKKQFLPIDLESELERDHERDLTSNVVTKKAQDYLKKNRKTVERQDGEAVPLNDNFIVEPDMNTVLSQLLPKMAHLMVYTALLDSVASEHAARMVAMQTATDNADELLRQLNLQYNKSRQQAITSELLDIVGGSVNN